jgi:hypothetical protein
VVEAAAAAAAAAAAQKLALTSFGIFDGCGGMMYITFC